MRPEQALLLERSLILVRPIVRSTALSST